MMMSFSQNMIRRELTYAPSKTLTHGIISKLKGNYHLKIESPAALPLQDDGTLKSTYVL